MHTLALTLGLLLLTPIICQAEGHLSLQQAVQAALAKNHLLQAVSHEVTAAEEDVKLTKRKMLPTLLLEENGTISNSPTRVFMMKLDQGRFAAGDFDSSRLNDPASYHDFRTTLTLDQPIFNFSLLRSATLSEATAEIGRLAAEQRKQEVAGKAYAAWLEVRRAKANLYVAEKAVSDAHEHLRIAVAKVAAGTGLKSDELRARTFLVEVERGQISAANDVSVARMQLGLVTGCASGEEVDIDDVVTVAEIGVSREEWHQRAAEHRLDLKVMAKEQERAGMAVKLAKAAYYPTVNATASYQLNDLNVPFGRDKDSWQASLSLRWELFSGFRTGNEVAKHRALQQAADEYQREYKNMVAFQINEALLRYEEARKRHDKAQLAVVDAEESVRLIGKRFQNALSPLVELLDAQTALNKARAGLVEAENGQGLAVARIWQAAGVFLKEALK